MLENGRGGFLSASTSKFEPQVTSALHATLKLVVDNDVDIKIVVVDSPHCNVGQYRASSMAI